MDAATKKLNQVQLMIALGVVVPLLLAHTVMARRTDSGSAYINQQDFQSNAWTLQQKLVAGDGFG